MKTSIRTTTVEEETHEIDRDELESMLIKSLGIKRAFGISFSVDFDISSGGFLRSCTIKTQKETTKFLPAL